MSKSIPYADFGKFSLRIPFLPLDDLKTGLKNSDWKLEQLRDPQLFTQGLRYAASSFYKRHISDTSKIFNADKAGNTAWQYLIRATTRATPFGLFAGPSVGHFDRETQLVFQETLWVHDRIAHQTQEYLARSIARTYPEKLCWYPNSSLYLVGAQWRYFFREADGNYRFKNFAANVFDVPFFAFLKNGKSIEAIVEYFTTKGYEAAEARNFIKDLISQQILTYQLFPILHQDQASSYFKSYETHIKKGSCGDPAQEGPEALISAKFYQYLEPEISWSDLREKISEHPLHRDAYPEFSSCTINKEVRQDFKKALSLFARLTPRLPETRLKRFKRAFSDRYQTQKVPLAVALDLETGIPYGDPQTYAFDPLLEGLYPKSSPKLQTIDKDIWSEQKILLNRLLQKSSFEGYTDIHIKESDLASISHHWEDIPDSICGLGSLVREKSQEVVFVDTFIGPSAAKFLGRFSMGSESIRDLYQAMIAQEQKSLSSDQVKAEIILNPLGASSNIMGRPRSTDYEIPVFGQQNPGTTCIYLNDLYIALKNERFILTAQGVDQQIIPSLHNAHHYTQEQLVLYTFLCDLEKQETRNQLSLDWGFLQNIYWYFPRVYYQKVLVSKARWILRGPEIQQILGVSTRKERAAWQNKYHIPNWIELTTPSGFLTLDLDNDRMFELFQQKIKTKHRLEFSESLFATDAVVRDTQGRKYVHELMIPFYKTT